LIAVAIAALALTIAVAVELLLPGRDLYHAGWYNVGLAALTVLALIWARRQFARSASMKLRAAVALVACGVLVLGIAGVASGLFAPDNQTVVGAPGQNVTVGDLDASLFFPPVRGETADAQSVGLVRQNHTLAEIGPARRDVGNFILSTMDRTVVYVQAYDSSGAHLTITQPQGVAFLSPVLLMQQHQAIAGFDLPFDSFAVPAAHRIVKAVLFTPQQAAALRGMAGVEVPAVLFAVDDESDRPLPHAIALAIDGQTVAIGGLRLYAKVLDYPSVELVAAPSLIAVVLGAALVLGGLTAAISPQRRFR
jgi:hypothetical protein